MLNNILSGFSGIGTFSPAVSGVDASYQGQFQSVSPQPDAGYPGAAGEGGSFGEALNNSISGYGNSQAGTGGGLSSGSSVGNGNVYSSSSGAAVSTNQEGGNNSGINGSGSANANQGGNNNAATNGSASTEAVASANNIGDAAGKDGGNGKTQAAKAAADNNSNGNGNVQGTPTALNNKSKNAGTEKQGSGGASGQAQNVSGNMAAVMLQAVFANNNVVNSTTSGNNAGSGGNSGKTASADSAAGEKGGSKAGSAGTADGKDKPQNQAAEINDSGQAMESLINNPADNGVSAAGSSGSVPARNAGVDNGGTATSGKNAGQANNADTGAAVIRNSAAGKTADNKSYNKPASPGANMEGANQAASSVSGGANTILKGAIANAAGLTALNGEIKQAASSTQNADSGNISGNGTASSANNKILEFINSASFQGNGSSGGQTGAGGGQAGFGLSGGNAAGSVAASGEPSGTMPVQSLMLMLKNNVQSAVITLNPQSLGTVKINISLNNLNQALNSANPQSSGGSITVSMVAQNEAARNALQSSSSSLQNALKNQGFSSINLNISYGSGSNGGNGGNWNETGENLVAKNYYGGSASGGLSVSAAPSSLMQGASPYRNPEALIDHFV